MRMLASAALTLTLVLSPLPAAAQGPGIIGCSIVPDSWALIQQGLDKLFFGACARHDFCYRTCNPVGGPYVGYGYKANCDTVFYAEMLLACETWSLLLSFPNIEWTDQQSFFNECAEYASYGYGLVLSAGTYFFLDGQCNEYCNQWACGQLGFTYGYFQQLACAANCWPGLDFDDCELRPWGYDCPPCPIGLDLQGNGLKLSGPNPPLYFDLNADGTPDRTSWTRVQTKDGFLAFDRNGNGRIDDGKELFGNFTPLLLSPAVARQGYEVLEEFDRAELGGNEDGMIDEADAVFEHLVVWMDVNRDAVTQDGELQPLAEVGVQAISLFYYHHEQEDQWGNVLRWWSPIYFEDGSESLSADVFFAPVPE